MKIAVIGAGAIGSVVAAFLTKVGQDVVLIGKAEQVSPINQHGLRVFGARGEERIKVRALTQFDKEYGLVIFTVKTQDLQDAINSNKKLLRDAILLSSQNGVQADHILKTNFPEENIISSIVMFGSTYIQAGEVVLNFEGDWIVGKPYSPNDGQVKRVTRQLSEAFNVVLTDEIIGMKWLKLFINFNNCIPAIIGKSMQETFADLDLCRLSIHLLKEGVDIIQKAGINLVSLPSFPVDRIYGMVNMPEDQAAGIIQKTLTSLSKEPLYGSILQSIMRGRRSEIDYINGEVVRLAGQSNMEAPLNRKIVDLVHQVEREQKYYSINQIIHEFQLNTKISW